MIYQVLVTPVAEAAIERYIDYIKSDLRSPLTAERVLRRVYAAIAKLEVFPHAAGRAPEDEHRDYLIRFRMVGQCLILFNVDDRIRTVRVIGFRHGSQEPRIEDLPNS